VRFSRGFCIFAEGHLRVPRHPHYVDQMNQAEFEARVNPKIIIDRLIIPIIEQKSEAACPHTRALTNQFFVEGGCIVKHTGAFWA